MSPEPRQFWPGGNHLEKIGLSELLKSFSELVHDKPQTPFPEKQFAYWQGFSRDVNIFGVLAVFIGSHKFVVLTIREPNELPDDDLQQVNLQDFQTWKSLLCRADLDEL